MLSSLIIGTTGYFIIGGIIRKVHFKKSGAEIIPNKTFWFALPGAIKVIGIIFLFFIEFCGLICTSHAGRIYHNFQSDLLCTEESSTQRSRVQARARE